MYDLWFCVSATDAKERQQWVDRLRGTAEYHTANLAQVIYTVNTNT